MTKLRPLTSNEIERLTDLYAMAPLTTKEIDKALALKGWVEFDGDATEIAKRAYRKDNGRPCLYESNGTVAVCWKLDAK